MNPTATTDDIMPETADLLPGLALAALAGGLLAAGYGLHPVWWAPWLAPIPLLFAASRASHDGRLLGAVAGAVAVTSILPYLLPMPLWGTTIAIVVLRIWAWMLATRLTVAASRRFPLIVSMLVLPTTIAATEMLTLVVSPHGAAGSLAYSQMDMPALAQAGSLGGVPAVAFLVLLPGAFVGLALGGAHADGARVKAALLLGAILTGVIVFSAHRLADRPAGRQASVALVATNRFRDIPTRWDVVWAVYRPAVQGAAPAGGLVVLPEKIALLSEARVAAVAADVSAVAVAKRATIVVGVEVKGSAGYRNRALITTPDGRTAWYDKQRMVPRLEARDIPGRTPFRMPIQGGLVGVAICKDMHVPSIGATYAGVGLMLVPAWDFGDDGEMGARMTAFRGIESGYWIARSARDGLIGVYDPQGRTRAERLVGARMTVLRTDVGLSAPPTVYHRVGNLFGWLCVVFVLLLLAAVRRGKMRPAEGHDLNATSTPPPRPANPSAG